MTRNRHWLILLLLLFATSSGMAQDSVYVLTRNHLMSILKTFHPVIKQADLNVRRAKAELLQSRGAFDPKIGVELANKTFDGKDYYKYFNPQLSVPLWYGLNIKTGTEQLRGERTNPEMTLGSSSYLGIQLNANQLLFDKRRAIVRQASLLSRMSEAEQQMTVNNVLFEALGTYWKWAKEYSIYKIIKESVQLNEDRFNFVKLEYEQGNRPAIDTTEALAQLQNFYFMLNNAALAYKKAGFELADHLWNEDGTPFIWNENIIPPAIESVDLSILEPVNNYLDKARNAHPKLISAGYKIDVLEVERRLKFQSFLPDLGIQTNLLNKGFSLPNDFSSNYYNNNHKLALSLNIPIFFRSATGAYNSVRFKIQQSRLDRDYLGVEIQNKIKAYYTEVNAVAEQIAIYEAVYENNRKLLSGESLRLEVGESTLFILNSRENKLLEIAQKLEELKAKWHTSFAGLYYATGSFN